MDSDQSGKYMSLHAFKGDLQLMVANVMNMATEQQEATGAPVSFDRKSLMGFIESSMPQEDQYVVELPIVDYSGGLGPFFFKLPRELRDRIFSDLVTSGNPHFMRVSRVMKIEGMDLIYKKGVYRMNFGYDVYRWNLGFLMGNCPGPIQKVADNIRNLSITVKVRDFSSRLPTLPTNGHSEAFQYVDMFVGSLLTYGDCNMGGCCNTVTGILWNMILIIRGLIAFDTVMLHIDTDVNYSRASGPVQRWESQRIAGFRHTARKYLEPFLGKEVLESDNDELRLIFHPRKARGEMLRESDQDLRTMDVHTYMKTQTGQDCGQF